MYIVYIELYLVIFVVVFFFAKDGVWVTTLAFAIEVLVEFMRVKLE